MQSLASQKRLEVQLKQVVIPLFRDYLAENGVRQFPQQKKSRGGPIIVDGVFNKNRPLGHIKEALNCAEAELMKFCEDHGFSLTNVLTSIEELLLYRNKTAHGEALTLPRLTELREKWLGVGVKDGGIFRFIVTDRFDPRLAGF
jgi:hypothetical protein